MNLKTRSQHIREHLNKIRCNLHRRASSNHKDGPTQIVKSLKKKGINVTIHHVGMVKLQMRKKSLCNKNKSNYLDIKFAKKLLDVCNNDIDLAKYNLEVVSKLLGSHK
jgi:hypothetical protein